MLGRNRMASGREEAVKACAVSFGSNQEGSVLLAVFLRFSPCSDSTEPTKALQKIKRKGLGTQPQKKPHHIYQTGSKRFSNELGYLHIRLEVRGPAGSAVCKG